MAFLGAVVTLCGVFFLCHNVLQISMAGDIRKLGLLNTIGATQRQLSKIYYSQIRRILVLGTAAGAALSAILLAGVIPAILNSQYFRETGGAEGFCLFHPVILLLSVLFTDGILLAASAGCPVWKVPDIQERRVKNDLTRKESRFSRKENGPLPGKCVIWRGEIFPVTGNGLS